ncbi:MAG: PaaI family thioesterase [Myxococcaceae bacterium]|nr:PaaI family thioesterase [Myxococcaceae bacterium]
MSRERQFQWADPQTLIRGAEGKTGLAFLQAILKGELPGAPISAALNFKLVHAEEGTVRFEGWPDECHYNPMGSVHGGWSATLLDSAMGSAVMSTLDAATAYTTMDFTVHLVRGLTKDTGAVVAEGRVLHRGARAATAEGRLTDSKGKLLAHASTTCLLMPRK